MSAANSNLQRPLYARHGHAPPVLRTPSSNARPSINVLHDNSGLPRLPRAPLRRRSEEFRERRGHETIVCVRTSRAHTNASCEGEPSPACDGHHPFSWCVPWLHSRPPPPPPPWRTSTARRPRCPRRATPERISPSQRVFGPRAGRSTRTESRAPPCAVFVSVSVVFVGAAVSWARRGEAKQVRVCMCTRQFLSGTPRRRILCTTHCTV